MPEAPAKSVSSKLMIDEQAEESAAKANRALELTGVAQLGAGMGARRAERVLKSPDETLRLLDAAVRKAKRKGHGSLEGVWDGFKMLIRLTRAYVGRQYTRVPWKTMLYATGAIIYFVSPFDLIPDFIVGIGLLDDAAVIGWVLRSIKKDLEEFREWEIETGRLTSA